MAHPPADVAAIEAERAEQRPAGRPVGPGDVVSRNDRAPFYSIVATAGDWAWARHAETGVYVTIFRPDYRRFADRPG